MYGRYSNPYAELGEGIQQGLSTWADSQVKLAQIRNDRELRDRDYSQRLREFNSQEDWRNKQYALQHAQESRAAQEEQRKDIKYFEDGIRGALAPHTLEDGSIRFTDPIATKQSVYKMNATLKSSPYGKEFVKSYLGDRADDFEFTALPNGTVGVKIWKNGRENKPGILTANASNDPNDPVVQLDGSSLVEIGKVMDMFQSMGVRPDQARYFLSSDLSLTPEGEQAVGQFTTQQNSGTGGGTGTGADTGTGTDTGSGTGTDVVSGSGNAAAIDASSPSKVSPFAPGREGQYKLDGKSVDTADGIGGAIDAITTAASNVAKGFGEAFLPGDKSSKGQQPGQTSSEKKADIPTFNAIYDQIEAKLQAGDLRPDDLRDISQNETILKAVMRDTEVSRRGMQKLKAGHEVANKALGRMMMVEMASGNIEPERAIAFMQGARARESDVAELYLRSPTAAAVQFQYMSKAKGADGKDYTKEVTDGINKVLADSQKNIDSERRMPLGELGNSARAAMQFVGIIRPEDQYAFLNKNHHQLMSALERAQSQKAQGYHADRDMASVVAMNLMSELRIATAPADFTPDQKAKYEDGAMELLKHFRQHPQVAGMAMEYYYQYVQDGEKLKTATEEIKAKFDASLQRALEKKSQ